MKLKKFIHRHRMILYIFSPILLFVFVLVAMLLTNRNYRKLIVSSYESHLSTIYENMENAITNAIDITDAVLGKENILEILEKNPLVITSQEYETVSQALASIMEKSTVIDSMFVYNRPMRMVYSHDGEVYTTDQFFGSDYIYEGFEKNYWGVYENYRTAYRILLATIVHTPEESKLIIPIIFSMIDGKDIKSTVTVNVDGSSLLEKLNQHKTTENSYFQVLAKHIEIFYDSNSVSPRQYDKDIKKQCLQSASFEAQIEGETYIIVSYTRQKSMFASSYVAFIPESDISAKTLPLVIILIMIGIVICMMLIWMLKRNLDMIFAPARKIVAEYKDELTQTHYDPIKDIENIVHKINLERNEYRNQLQDTLSVARETKIIALLNQNNVYAESMTRFLVKEEIEEFKYKYFAAIVVNISFSEKFYQEFPFDDYKKNLYEVKQLIRGEFVNQGFLCYDMPCNISDTFYLLLNVESAECEDKVSEILNGFARDFEMEKTSEYMQLLISYGGIDYSIKGLMDTHKRAMRIFDDKVEGIQPRLNLVGNLQSPDLRFDEERIIINRCLTGTSEETYAYLEGLMLKSVKMNPTHEALVRYYSQILSALLSAFRSKKPEVKLSELSDSELAESMAKDSPENLLKFVRSLLHMICDDTKNNHTMNINMITAYIDTHYTNSEITLTSVADTFGVSSKYLSRKFKEKTGLRFMEYLTGLRVEKAKKLLLETDLSVEKIGCQVGYPVISTFVQAFKSKQGQSPAEFRASQKRE